MASWCCWARHDIHGSHGAFGGGSLVGVFSFFFSFLHFFLVQRHRFKAARSSIWFGIKDQND